ncbi:MAG: DUF6794 domain-containing protein [bacterium]
MRKLILLFFVLILLTTILFCRNRVDVPINLEDCFVKLDSILPDSTKQEIMESKDDDMTRYHMGLGMWIRNNWIYGHTDESLSQLFFPNGIMHVDDVSSIILTSYWRYLNNKPIRLDEQTQYYIDYWKEEMSKPEMFSLNYFNKSQQTKLIQTIINSTELERYLHSNDTTRGNLYLSNVPKKIKIYNKYGELLTIKPLEDTSKNTIRFLWYSVNDSIANVKLEYPIESIECLFELSKTNDNDWILNNSSIIETKD